MNRVHALLWKDLRLFFGDKKAVLITFLVPIGIASFFASLNLGGSGPSKTTKIPVLVADNDGSPLTKRIIAALEKDSMAQPKVVSEREADEAVKAGRSGVAVVFPKGFGEDAPKAMFRGEAPTVDLRYDPSKNLEMQAVQGSIMQVAMQTVSQSAFSTTQDYTKPLDDIEASRDLTAEQKKGYRALFADLQGLSKLNNGLPQSASAGGVSQPFKMRATPQTAAKEKGGDEDYSGLAHSFAGMAMQGVLFFGINAAMAILTDRRKGIWRRLRASPVGLGEMLAGKALSSALISAVVLLGVLGFGMLVFHMRVAGSWLGLGLVVAAAALMTAAFGLLVASLGRTEEQSRGLSTLAVLTMVMLGGAWFPAFLMPDWVQALSRLVPVRWALDGLDGALWRGWGLAQTLAPVAALLAFTLVFGAVAAFRFRTMPETP